MVFLLFGMALIERSCFADFKAKANKKEELSPYSRFTATLKSLNTPKMPSTGAGSPLGSRGRGCSRNCHKGGVEISQFMSLG